MMSATHSRFGPVAVNCRFTRSAGCGKAASHTVVQRFAPRLTPCISSCLNQPLYRATSHAMAFPLKLTPHLPGAVHLVVLFPHAIDFRRQCPVLLHPRRQPPRVRCPGLVFVVRRRGDRQLLADRLDPKSLPVLVDEGHHLAG